MPPDHEVSRPQAVTIPPTCCGGSISGSLPLRPTDENNVTRETPQPNTQLVAMGTGIGTNEKEGTSQSPSSVKSKFYLTPALRTAFSAVGATDKAYSFREILGLLKTYLYAKRHLFDPDDILFVNCANDPLGQVFKVDRFHYNEVRNLIARHIFPEYLEILQPYENRNNAVSSNVLKRASSSDERTSVGIVNGCKGVTPSFYANGNTFSLASSGSAECEVLDTHIGSQSQITGTEKQGSATVYAVPGTSRHRISSKTASTLAIPVPAVPESNSEAETDYSFQGYETAYCRNTEFEDSDESEESEFVEYEIASDDDIEELPHSDDNDSIIEDVEVAVLALQTFYEDDIEEAFWADDSDTDQSTDEDHELVQDKWDCVTCGIKNKPFVRYCGKCWQLRKNWLPERPKKKRKPRPKKKLRRRSLSTDQESNSERQEDSGKESSELSRTLSTATTVSVQSDSPQDLNCEQLSSQDSGIFLSQEGSTQSSQDPVMEVPLKKKSGFKDKDACQSSSNLHPKTSKKTSEVSGELSSRETVNLKRKTPFKDEIVAKKCKNSDTELSDEGDSEMAKFHAFLKSEEGYKWIQSTSTKELRKAFEASGSDNTDEKHMCLICCIRPKNATITHGRLSHQATCYQCARRLLDSGARCPVCRRKIHLVSKNIIV